MCFFNYLFILAILAHLFICNNMWIYVFIVCLFVLVSSSITVERCALLQTSFIFYFLSNNFLDICTSFSYISYMQVKIYFILQTQMHFKSRMDLKAVRSLIFKSREYLLNVIIKEVRTVSSSYTNITVKTDVVKNITSLLVFSKKSKV